MLWITQLMRRFTRRGRRTTMAPPEIEHMRLGDGRNPPGIVASGKAHLTSTVDLVPVSTGKAPVEIPIAGLRMMLTQAADLLEMAGNPGAPPLTVTALRMTVESLPARGVLVVRPPEEC